MKDKLVVLEKDGKTSLVRLGALGAGAGTALTMMSPANAEVDVSAEVGTMKTDGIATLTVVGLALISMAAVAVVLKWGKAAFFS